MILCGESSSRIAYSLRSIRGGGKRCLAGVYDEKPRLRLTGAAILPVIDHLLKVELPQGPIWLRYNEERVWPLLTGERAHYELGAGEIDQARRLLGNP